MARSTLAALVVLCATLAAVIAGALVLIERDRAELARRFAADRQARLEAAARDVSDALEDVGDDLRFAAELLSRSGSVQEHERELSALLEVVGQYRAIAVYGPGGELALEVYDRRAHRVLRDEAVVSAMQQTASRAMSSTAGDVVTSPPVEGAPSGWYRAFASALIDEGRLVTGAVVVLVDTEPFFAPLRLVASETGARLVLLGASGRSTPATDPKLADLITGGELAALPAFHSMLERMRAGERGSTRFGEAESRRLGLGEGVAVASFTPITVRAGQHWSVATVVPMSELRAHERAIILRLSAAASVAALLLLAFGTHVVIASRRAVALRESRRHAEKLAHLHEKTQKILDNIPTGVLALTEHGTISAVNQALKSRLPQAVGVTLSQAFSAAGEAVTARLSALVHDADIDRRVLTLQGELSLFGEPGRYRVHAVPLTSRDPEVHTLLVIEDLTNLQALESQLLRAEKLATVGILAAGIAHEIGTPLGVVRGRAEYLIGKLEPDHPQLGSAKVIIEEIDRVSRTIRQLLDFSRLQPASVRPVDLGAVARGLEELLSLEADRRRVHLTVDVEDDLPSIAADPDQLRQVLVNLLLNAFDASASGGRVSLKASSRGSGADWGLVRIEVRDLGCGIAPENLNRVFDPFFTTKKRGQGTGLGLATVAQIVRNHGGRIELTSELGAGTCATPSGPVAGAAAGERHAS